MIKLENSNCDKTQQHYLWQNLNSNCEKSKKNQIFTKYKVTKQKNIQNSKTQIGKEKNLNTQIVTKLKTELVTELRNSNCYKMLNLKECKELKM